MNQKMFTILFVCTLVSAISESAVHNSLDVPEGLPVFEDLPTIVSVEHQTVPVSIKASVGANVHEKSVYAVEETRVGYARLVRTGVTVQLGTTATMSYHMRFRGVSSSHLAQKDQRFIETLSKAERAKYFDMKKHYRDGLGVVFLRFLGINLEGNTDKFSQEKARRYTKQYNRKAAAAKAILEKFSKSSVTVSGHLTAIGVSFRPTTAFAFIEVARVKLSSGQIVTVVSSNKSAVQVRTADGKGVGTSEKQVKVEDEDDYYFEGRN